MELIGKIVKYETDHTVDIDYETGDYVDYTPIFSTAKIIKITPQLNLWIQEQLRAGKTPHIEPIDSIRGLTNALALEQSYISACLAANMPLKNVRIADEEN